MEVMFIYRRTNGFLGLLDLNLIPKDPRWQCDCKQPPDCLRPWLLSEFLSQAETKNRCSGSTSTSKACNDWIPTYNNLQAHKVHVDNTCPMCHGHSESILHALWECSKLKKDFFFDMAIKQSRTTTEELAIIVWRM
ncbi:conserved hypothetical protein [Ricinus communis]|uniref:Reverse transcriptase zinc-binding domain-containing protein n=1 Tax=Ricinus communis TaxID=3988 RepID=B9SF58_RICCO|nr:conserved hypothetical protein [Ricinus communis]